jgi:hypothetical protein
MCGWFRDAADIDEMNLTPFLRSVARAIEAGDPDAIAIELRDFG